MAPRLLKEDINAIERIIALDLNANIHHLASLF